MNKKMRILLSTVVAAVLVLAMSVTAFAAAPTTSITQDAKSGDEVRVTISLGGEDLGLSAKITPSANLTFQGIEGNTYAREDTVILGPGFESATYVYTVSGEAGDAYNVTLSSVETSGSDGQPVSQQDVVLSSEIAGAVEPEPTPSEQPSEQPSEEPSEQPSEQPSEEPSEQPSEEPSEQPSEEPTPSDEQPAPSAQPSDSTSQDELDDVPKTGDATTDAWVWIAVAIVAGATIAVIAGKKVADRK